MWVIDGTCSGRPAPARSSAVTAKKESVDIGLHQWTIDDIHVGAYDPKVRLEVLDEFGIDAQVIFPSTIGLGGQDLGMIADHDLCRMVRRDLQRPPGRDPGRVGQPPPADAADAGVERRPRASPRPSASRALGSRGVNMTSDPQDLGAPDLADRAWDPFWETCAELQLPVHFHIGASVTAMTFYGQYPWAVAVGGHQARDRRLAALHRERRAS